MSSVFSFLLPALRYFLPLLSIFRIFCKANSNHLPSAAQLISVNGLVVLVVVTSVVSDSLQPHGL